MPPPEQRERRPDDGSGAHSVPVRKKYDDQRSDGDRQIPYEDLAAAYVEAVRLHDEAVERRLRQQLEDARRAAESVEPRPVDEVGVEAGRIYRNKTRMVEAGLLVWDAKLSDWVRPKRPRRRPSSSPSPEPYSATELLGHFDRVRTRRAGAVWSARCPAHEDRSPSLSIAVGRSAYVFWCWAGCSFDEVVRAAGLDERRLFG